MPKAALDGSTNDNIIYDIIINDNIINDNAKLLREGKDILDQLLDTSVEQRTADAMMEIVVQLNGFQDLVSLVHLDQDGLYVALSRQRLQYPRSTASLRRFGETMDALLALKDQLCSINTIINDQMDLYKGKHASLGSKHAPLFWFKACQPCDCDTATSSKQKATIHVICSPSQRSVPIVSPL